jgi:hypothetical protein
MADKNVRATVEEVTPAMAEAWLGKNLANRSVRQRVVEGYARDMRNGAWQLTGEPIKFSINGRLLDGQHRLQAVVRAEIPVEMLVVRGLPDSTQAVMDSGARRTAGDALKLRGETSYTALAATARLAIFFTRGVALEDRNTPPTHTEILAFIDNHPDLREALAVAHHYRNGVDIPPSTFALAIWQLARVDLDGCNAFVAQLAEKTHLKKGDAVLALIDRLGDIRRNGRRATATDFISLIFRAWNYWRDGKTVDLLPLRKAGGPIDIPTPR